MKSSLYLILLILFVACNNQKKIKSKVIKNKISLSKVKEVWVKEPQAKDSILLDKKQTELFIKNWNTAYPSGLCKFFPKYLITVTLTNNHNRKFRVNANSVKEGGDECFKMSSTINYTN